MGWEDRQYANESSYRGGIGGGGGGITRQWNMHSVTTWLIIINAVVFILDSMLAQSSRADFLAPRNWGEFTVAQGIYQFQLWRWVTYQFLHGDIFHIFFNMLVLYFFGPVIEAWWGRWRFLTFYLISGMGGALIYSILVETAPGVIFDAAQFGGKFDEPAMVIIRHVPVVGASGSIFGVLVAMAVLYPHQRVMLLIPPIPMKMRTLAFVLIGVAFLALMAGSRNAGGEAGHLGGAAIGYLLVKMPWLLKWADPYRMQQFGAAVSEKKRLKNIKRWQQEEAEVDRILAKVKDEGLQSLTSREKKILQQATERKR